MLKVQYSFVQLYEKNVLHTFIAARTHPIILLDLECIAVILTLTLFIVNLFSLCLSLIKISSIWLVGSLLIQR